MSVLVCTSVSPGGIIFLICFYLCMYVCVAVSLASDVLSPPDYAPARSLDDSDLLLANTRHSRPSSSSSSDSSNGHDSSSGSNTTSSSSNSKSRSRGSNVHDTSSTTAAVGDPDYDLYNDDRDGDIVCVLYNAVFDVILVAYECGAVHVFEPKVWHLCLCVSEW